MNHAVQLISGFGVGHARLPGQAFCYLGLLHTGPMLTAGYVESRLRIGAHGCNPLEILKLSSGSAL